MVLVSPVSSASGPFARSTRRVLPGFAASTPSTPPAPASSSVSVNSWRSSLRRPAPSAIRTVISRVRDTARTSMRLATLAHTIRAIRPTAHIKTISGAWYSRLKRENPSAPELTSIGSSRRSDSNCARSLPDNCERTASASIGGMAVLTCASVAPGAARPIICSHDQRRSSSIFCCGESRGCIPIGTQMSVALPTRSPKPAGMMPTIVSDTWFRLMALPITEGSRPKRRFQ